MDRAEAVLLLGRLHAAQGAVYAGGEEGPVRALLTDDVHWHVPGRNAIAGGYRAVDAVVVSLAYFRRRRDLAGRTFRSIRVMCWSVMALASWRSLTGQW